MKIIGAGFGRTGTLSLKLALDQLGFGPTLHNSEFTNNAELRVSWGMKLAGLDLPWKTLFKGYHSAVDWPSSFFWPETAIHYPDAKIILTVRPVREWLASFKRTVLPQLWRSRMMTFGDTSVSGDLIGNSVFRGDLSDENLMRCYVKNTVDVRSIDPARVLEFNVRDGWVPLCRFLDVPIPETPFPKTNDIEQFQTELRLIS